MECHLSGVLFIETLCKCMILVGRDGDKHILHFQAYFAAVCCYYLSVGGLYLWKEIPRFQSRGHRLPVPVPVRWECGVYSCPCLFISISLNGLFVSRHADCLLWVVVFSLSGNWQWFGLKPLVEDHLKDSRLYKSNSSTRWQLIKHTEFVIRAVVKKNSELID